MKPALLMLVLLCVPCLAQLPTFSHVVVVLEENHNYSSVIGSSSMPYLNGLANTYGLGMQYYANTHPSIGNYFELTTGQVITNDDSFSGVVKADNVVRHLIAAGKTWKSYEEDLPSVGYIKPDVAKYARRHCPLSYLQDVVTNSTQRRNLVPFTQFASDVANGALPDYSFVTPNLCNDAHDCTLDVADAWLKANIDPLLTSSFFQNGLLIIVFDEAGNDNTHGGGRVAWLAVSPNFSKPAFKSSTLYQHQNTLRLMMEGLGLTTFPGQARNANNMSEFFQ
ncbi:MAG TPA: alkaline phosphatase family protein [Terriglobales bacterium]|nr:alkaline phosphatase family protein [Terriglobales bacterium]